MEEIMSKNNKNFKLVYIMFNIIAFCFVLILAPNPSSLFADSMSVKFVINSREVKGYPTEIKIKMSGDANYRYVHIFHKENVGGSLNYYYQGTIPFVKDRVIPFQLWLGDKKLDEIISYQIIAVTNNVAVYEAYPKTYINLPGDVADMVEVERIE